jgi:hypothetical protein
MRPSDDIGLLPPEDERDLARRITTILRDQLPQTWEVEFDLGWQLGPRQPDALITLHSPDGSSVTILVEAKRLVHARDVEAAREQLRHYAQMLGRPSVGMIAARYLSPATRERLSEAGVAYGDATGNLHVAFDQPALFIHTSGADRDPWRGPGRPRGSLKGAPAAHVVRALADYRPPFSVPQLAALSGVSTGAVYRVVKFLEEEALVIREPRGQIIEILWRRIIERWSNDYRFQEQSPMGRYLIPRGIESLPDVLRHNNFRYVLTGSLAAHYFLPYAPARLGMLYVDDPQEAADWLGLRLLDEGANVLVASGLKNAAFARTTDVDGLRIASPSQIAVDLLTAPGRGPAEAEALLDWMERHESDWRREPTGPSPLGTLGRT